MAVYEGAKVTADAVRRGIDGLRTSSTGKRETRYETNRRERQKQGLQDSLGISTMRDNRLFLNTLIGFSGYNQLVKTKQYPNGQPNQLAARIFNSGTSSLKKQPFFDNAVRQTRELAKKQMENVFENAIKNEMGE